MTIHTAVTFPSIQPQLTSAFTGTPINLEAGTVIWSAEGMPVAEIICQQHNYTVNLFAQPDRDLIQVQAFFLQGPKAATTFP